jgi:threonine/homoserine/homoserine lactone efflux protein
MIHVLVAGAGLSALLNGWPPAFDIIRWVGVAYLLWLAVQALKWAGGAGEVPRKPARHAFRAGLFVNLTNPKVILFVLAFIPQFVVPEAGPVLLQFLAFGAVIGLGGLIINGLVGTWAGSVGRKLANGNRWLDRLTAGIFTALALRLALLERS